MPPKKRKNDKSASPTTVQADVSLQQHKSPTPTVTNYIEIQNNELEVLRSIYMDDFEETETKAAAWNRSPDIAFRIKVRAPSSPQFHVTLSVQLNTTYPKTLPSLKIESFEAASGQGLPAKIQNCLRNLPPTLIGHEMIFTIASTIESLLEDAAEAQARKPVVPSLEEERIVREAAHEELVKKKEQDLAKKLEAETAEEDRMLQEQLENEIARRTHRARRSRRSVFTDSEELDGSISSTRSHETFFDQSMSIRDAKGHTYRFKGVLGIAILSKSVNKTVKTVAPLLSNDELRGTQLLLKEITYPETDGPKINSFRERIAELENMLNSAKARKHPNVVELIGFKLHRSSDIQSGTAPFWELRLLYEFANKGSLSDLLDMVGSLGADQVRGWTVQLLDALEFFEHHNIIHPEVQLESIFLFRSRSGDITIKLSDANDAALDSLSKTSRGPNSSTSDLPYWTAPELSQTPPQQTTKTAIWGLGVVALQMALGKKVIQQHTSPGALMKGTRNFAPPFEEMLHDMLQMDYAKRLKAFQLVSSEFLRTGGQIFESDGGTTTADPLQRSRRESSNVNLASRVSRYDNDFDEAGRLGKGGFGEVVKARGRIDGRFYAIKKITSKSSTPLKNLLQEVVVLSRLNHPYVVRYFTAWIDDSPDDAESHIETTSTEETTSSRLNPMLGRFSNAGHDFMSSGRYGNDGIQFAEDTDDDENDSDTQSSDDDSESDSGSNRDQPRGFFHRPSAAPEPSKQRETRGPASMKSTLYIQMEYCENHTLRDVIRDGLWRDIDEQWRFFRQIVDGLSHMHNNGIIHRDLKPDNVFIDIANNPKIGDFGLATSGLSATAMKPSGTYQAAGSNTYGLGTVYYTAPELRSSSGQYNAKVDMYALGVVFFEMCQPFTTGMERDSALTEIRRRDVELPLSFKSQELRSQGEIILSLLTHRPEDRPSAGTLLTSGRIPEPFKEIEFRRALLELSQTDPIMYQNHLAALFSQLPTKVQDQAWDYKTPVTTNKEALLMSQLVKERLKLIFQRHGAIEISIQPLLPASEQYPGAVKLIDQSGLVVQLPYDLTMANARSIARKGPLFERSYCFENVYRPSTKSGEPRKISEVDLDIMSSKSTDLSVKEAELLKILDQIVDDFPVLSAKRMCFHINHSDLLDLILEFCRIPESQWALVKDSLPKLNTGVWSNQDMRNYLRDASVNLPSTTVDDLLHFNFRSKIDQIQDKIEALFANTKLVDRVAPIVARLRSVTNYAYLFKVKQPIFVQPLSCLNEMLYRGSFLFQCLSEGKKNFIIAVGGRYDKLIEDLRAKDSPSNHRAVGFQLNWGEINAMMTATTLKPNKTSKKQKSLSEEWKARRCDVIVTSFDPAILRTTALEVVEDLWAGGISAELSDDPEVSHGTLSHGKQADHSWVVSIRHEAGAVGERGLKVRSLIKKEESEVSMSELIPWLKSELRERGEREANVESNKLNRLPSHQDVTLLDPELEVHVLSAQHKGKKTNRRQIVDSARIRARGLVDSFLTGQCAAIETNDDILEAMKETRLSDPDTWRQLIQHAPLNERKYLQQVYDLLKSFASEGKDSEIRHAFIFNFRTRNCILYDLGRVV